MKKFKFSLDRIRDYKEQLLDREKNALAQLREQMRKLDERRLDLENEFSILNEELTQKTISGITVIEVKSYHYRLDNTRYQIKQLERDIVVLQGAIDRQLKVVVAASQEVSGLDKLHEKQLDEYNKMVAKADEQVIAEYVSTKLVRERQGA